MKKGPRELLCPFHYERTQLKFVGAIYEPEGGSSPETKSTIALILEFLTSRTATNMFLLFINYPVHGMLLQQPKWTNKLSNLQIPDHDMNYHGRSININYYRGKVFLILQVIHFIGPLKLLLQNQISILRGLLSSLSNILRTFYIVQNYAR